MQKGKKNFLNKITLWTPFYKVFLEHYYSYWLSPLRPFNSSVFALKGSIDEQEELSESAPQTLLVFGGGDNEGSFFSDLFTMPVEELRRD